jgi:hypothetical protein
MNTENSKNLVMIDSYLKMAWLVENTKFWKQ